MATINAVGVALKTASGTGDFAGTASTVFSTDITVNGVRVGLGTDNISTNLVVGGSLPNATSGSQNLAIGYQALADLVSGSDNLAIGYQALLACDTGSYNLGIGNLALSSTSSGAVANIGIGSLALEYCTGSNNTGIGVNVGSDNATGQTILESGNDNTLLGYGTSVNNNAASGTIAIGYEATGIQSTGSTSGTNGPGISIGSASAPVGFRGDGSIFPSASAGAGTLPLTFTGFWSVYINGTNYKIPLYLP